MEQTRELLTKMDGQPCILQHIMTMTKLLSFCLIGVLTLIWWMTTETVLKAFNQTPDLLIIRAYMSYLQDRHCSNSESSRFSAEGSHKMYAVFLFSIL